MSKNISFEQSDLFISARDGCHTYRIPALIVSKRGTVLAFCEGRRKSIYDEGDIDIVLKRSTDCGKTWSEQQIVHQKIGTGENTIGNPCAVVDEDRGTIWLAFCRNNKEVFVSHSANDGEIWSKPVNITTEVKKPNWKWYATGPGVGIQLKQGKYKGRLIIPCDHDSPEPNPSDPDRAGMGVDGESFLYLSAHAFVPGHPPRYHGSQAIYSDDHGSTWNLSEAIGPGANECQVVELIDPPGELMMNIRMQSHKKGQRGISKSKDGGQTWSQISHDPNLPCPKCQASIIRYSTEADGQKNRLLFSNPLTDSRQSMTAKLCYEEVKGPSRNGMTVRLSYDEGKSWGISKLIYEGSSAYSCLTVMPDKTIGLLYERDDATKLTLARFSLHWLTNGEDTVC